jgi:hypothetical protein
MIPTPEAMLKKIKLGVTGSYLGLTQYYGHEAICGKAFINWVGSRQGKERRKRNERCTR